jgi:hypothetical protein
LKDKKLLPAVKDKVALAWDAAKFVVHSRPGPALTADEVRTMIHASDAFKWAEINAETTAVVLKAMGLEDTDHVRVLAAIAEYDFDGALKDKKLSPAVKAKVALAWDAAKFVVHSRPGPALTADEVRTMIHASDAFKWAEINAETTAVVMKALGLEDTDHVRVLAKIVEYDFDGALKDKKLLPAVKAKVALAWDAAKFVVHSRPARTSDTKPTARSPRVRSRSPRVLVWCVCFRRRQMR